MTNEDIEALVQCVHVLRHMDGLGLVDKKIFQGFDYIVTKADEALERNSEVVPNWYKNNYWWGTDNQIQPKKEDKW